MIAVGFLVFQAKSDPSYASVGDCVHNKNAIAPGAQDSNPDVTVLPCSDPSADAKIVGKEPGSTDGDTVCQKYSDADGYYTQQQGSDRFTLCLHFLK